MQRHDFSGPHRLRVGDLTRGELVEELKRSGVLLNGSAEALLVSAVFDQVEVEDVEIVERTVGELGFPEGVTVSQILTAAQERGLRLCPPTTGPYMRLSMLDQQTAPNSIMSQGRAPSGSITVASRPLRDDDEYPKGFYLRVVDGVPWLRGYRCTDQHNWSADDRLLFRL